MEDNRLQTIELNVYDNSYSVETNRFCSIVLDTSKIKISNSKKKKLIKELRKKDNISDSNTNIDELYSLLIDSKSNKIPSNLLFHKSVKNLKSALILNYSFQNQALGDNLIGFLNLDFNKFDDFFKFFCTFIFHYLDKIPKKYKNKILKEFDINKKYFNVEAPKHILDISLLTECAKEIYDSEVSNLKEMQDLFKNFVDYIFNNTRVKKIDNLNNYQRFYIFQNTNEIIKELSKDYTCDYDLHFNFFDKNYMLDMLENVSGGNKNHLSDEDFLIKSIIKHDPTGEKITGSKHIFKTNNIFTYFYIILYYITLNNTEFIKRCQVCGRYFFSDKNTTLYCNNKYADDMTCKEFGIKTSQKRKENEEPVYGKYRTIYARKAMLVKRNPDIKSYKTNYEKWKKEAKQFMQDIKDGKKTYDEFDEWLDKNN